jgi:molybdopterin synthase sulfur carrier subunit
MIKVEFLGPIGKVPLEVDIKNLDELSNILKNDTQVSGWLEMCAVAINDTIIKDKNIILKDGDKVSLLPPVCGG